MTTISRVPTHEPYVPRAVPPPTATGAGRTGSLTTAQIHDGVHERRRRAG